MDKDNPIVEHTFLNPDLEIDGHRKTGFYDAKALGFKPLRNEEALRKTS